MTITPKIHGAPNMIKHSFPAYRESNNKMYVPYYYGVDNFDKPLKIKISQGDTINIAFKGELREEQKPVVKTYLDSVNGLCNRWWFIRISVC